MSWRVPYVDLVTEYQLLQSEIDKKLNQVFRSGRFVLGEQLREFESKMAIYLGCEDTVGVNSGSDAMLLALRALNVGPGDEVITVAHTHISTIAVIRYVGAIPVLVDIKTDQNIDPEKLEEAITKRTKAIIIVHLNGHSCNMEAVERVIGTIPLIEDACQSIGARYKGKKVGTFGIGCFSFHPLKTLNAAGDGGLVTGSKAFCERIRLLRNHGTKDRAHYEEWGYNSRLDEIQAAILSVKLPYLDKWITMRRELASFYNSNLLPLKRKEVISTPTCGVNYYDTYNSYTILCDRRDELKDYLSSKGIETMVSWNPPIHYQMRIPVSLPVTERVSKRVLSLPIHQYLTSSGINYVCKNIKEFYARGS